MAYLKHKNSTIFAKALASIISIIALASSTAYADTQSYAIGCGPNDATPASTPSGDLSCNGGSAPNESPYIAAFGTDQSKYPNGVTLTVISVDCGNDKQAKYKSNQNLSSLTCNHGAQPKKVSVTQKIKPDGTTTNSASCSDSQSQALCPYCSQNKTSRGCINPQSDSAVTCNSGQCDLITKYVNPTINILTVIFGLLAVISFILGGINFAASEGDPQKAAKAKQRIFNTVFAVIAYIFLYAFLQFLVPGGIFHGS